MTKQKQPKKPIPTDPTKAKLAEAEKLRDEYLAGWQRAKADFENYKKNEASRTDDRIHSEKTKLLLGFIGLIENLQKVKSLDLNKSNLDLDEVGAWVEGVMQIERQFRDILKENGLEVIRPHGERFNPELHEAVAQVEIEGKEPDIVVDVLQRGYKLNGTVIRPAKVKVSK